MWMRLVADDVALDRFRDSSLQDLGRVLEPDSFNDWVLGGLRTCLDKHGERCGVVMSDVGGRHPPPQLFRGRQHGLRLIDVKTNSLVDAPDGGEYVALSYVWGHSSSLLLLEHTRHDLYSPGGLAKFKIPQTIADAIRVVKKLGLRYLWVDAICIQQDDAADKSLQILRMHSVYFNAVATIVAAAGDHADAGLCGADPRYPRRPQIVAEAQGFRFIAASPSFLDIVHSGARKSVTPWASRAWTYQEYRLSRRMLIFSQDNVIWKCRSSELYEDWAGEV